MAIYKLEKHNAQTKIYEPVLETKLPDEEADAIAVFLSDCIHVEEFYKHTLTYADNRICVKHSSYNDVRGIVKARKA